jgi:RNA polymerase sigma-70 factor (ECF subfamily)
MSPAAVHDEADEMAFERLYRGSFALLVGQLFILTTNRAEAEEAVQEAFARLWPRWHELREWDNPEAWVRRVAINIAISRWRKHSRLVSLRESNVPIPDAGSPVGELAEALRHVRRKHRQALLLHHVIGLSVAEVASEMSARQGTVKSWLSRGRNELERLLLDKEDAGDD